MKSKLSLSAKLKMFAAFFVVLLFFSIIFLSMTIQKLLIEEKIDSSRKAVLAATMMLERQDAFVKSGKTTLAEAQKSALAEIKSVQLKKHQSFWVHDSGGTMLVEPLLPQFDGVDMSGYQDAEGKQAFADMTALVQSDGEASTSFYFKKPGEEKPVKKYAYIKLFKPWGWVVGTGFYIDDAIMDVRPVRNVSLFFIAFFVVTLGIAFLLLTRSVKLPITDATQGLELIGRQIASSARQFSDSSGMLAQASSEQAASLEETSSSLEEMSSMTRQNAENARQADTLMREASRVIEQANESITGLTHSMAEIARSSNETSHIIKTIDEIAFQTNLLALNAAVEAARAGEAGRGFAVVADEVRGLAMRAAEAAKSTAELIEATVGKINDGEQLMHKTNESFAEVADMGSKVALLVAEISTASQEQSQGIEQVSKVVVQMDTVTQQNAAHAEEYASSAQELKAKSDEMKQYIAELRNLIGLRARQALVEEPVRRYESYDEDEEQDYVKALPRV